MSQLEDVLERTFGFEGGFSDNPADRGGRTIWGISEKKNPGMWANGPPTKEAATDFYRALWLATGCAALEQAGWIDMPGLVFDVAVNSGQRRAIALFQRCVGAEPDGVLGPQTMAKAEQLKAVFGEPAVRNCYLIERVGFYHRLVSQDPTQKQFLLGWIGRVLQFYPTTRRIQ